MTVYVYAIDDDKYEAICQFVLKIRAEINYKFRIKHSIHTHTHKTQRNVQYRSHRNSRMHTLALTEQPHSNTTHHQKPSARDSDGNQIKQNKARYNRTDRQSGWASGRANEIANESNGLPITRNEWSSENARSNLLSANRKSVCNEFALFRPRHNCDCRT